MLQQSMTLRGKYIKEDIISFFDFDNDMKGINGEEFVLKRAIEKGYKNTAEYVADIIEGIYDITKRTDKAVDVFTDILEILYQNTYPDLYIHVDEDTEEEGSVYLTVEFEREETLEEEEY